MINFENILETLTQCDNDYKFKQAIEYGIDVLRHGKLILAGGNGGSASDAEHFVAELTGRYDGKTNVIPAVCMASNLAEVTAFGNDYGYENIFNPYIKGFPEASYLFITTSGRSKNILNAIDLLLKSDKKPGIVVLTGNDINNFIFERFYGDVSIISVDSTNTQIIQEMHIMILHYIAGVINKIGLI